MLSILQNGVLIYILAKYLLDLFSYDFHSILRVVRISRQELLSHAQTGFRLDLKARNTTIDLNKPETPKIDLSNMKYLSKLSIYVDIAGLFNKLFFFSG